MPIFCEYEGIKGNVTAEGFQNQINITSVSSAVARRVEMQPGNVANREITRPRLSAIKLEKDYDNSSASFFKESGATSTGKKVILHFVHTQDKQLQEYMSYVLDDCVVSGYSVKADRGKDGVPLERITLSYSKIVVSHTQYDKTNMAGSPVRTGYDLSLGKAV